MTAAIFHNFKAATGWQYQFDEVSSSQVAYDATTALRLIEQAETAAKNGQWVGMVISYEASALFNDAIDVHPDPDFPLVMTQHYAHPPKPWQPAPIREPIRPDWHASMSKSAYLAAVETIRAYITEGDTYQVNFTFALDCAYHDDALSWFNQLAPKQNTEYSAYLDFNEHQILSLSPELFFRRSGNEIFVKPMKGTAKPASDSPAQPNARQLAIEALKNSPKDRAENLMIVDLMRNDLAMVAQPGSVHVPKLFEVESYPSVLQMTSTVAATLEPSTTLVDLLTALFPCGSITGAPKIRTAQIINELENRPRRVYTGAIGLLEPNGDYTFNVPIRTLLLDKAQKRASYHTGSGITYDSVGSAEYAECMLKSAFLNT